MKEGVPVDHNIFFRRFMRYENLPCLVRLAEEERNELNFLLAGVTPEQENGDYGSVYASVCKSYPSLENMVNSIISKTEVVSRKREAKSMLQEIKPYFYELTGADKVKDPKILVKTGSGVIDFLNAGNSTNNVAVPVGAFGAFLPWAFGLGVPFAVVSGILYYSVAFLASAIVMFPHIKAKSAVAFPPGIADLIAMEKGNKTIVTSYLAHEYTHNVRMKTMHKEKSNSAFLEEGIATAVSNRVLDDMGGKQPQLRAFGKMQKLLHVLNGIYALVKMPLKLDFSFNYTGGSSMVHLAEFKYGKGIYKDLFRGKYGCLLD